MEAEVIVSLSAGGFEAGAEKVKRASSDMAGRTAADCRKISESTKAASEEAKLMVKAFNDPGGKGLERLKDAARALGAEVRTVAGAMGILRAEMDKQSGGSEKQVRQLKLLQDAHRALTSQLSHTRSGIEALTLPPVPSPAPPPLPPSGDPHGGNRQGLAHSGRAAFDMMLSGQSPLRAAMVEAPRVVQSLGGGLGAMLGVGAGLAVANRAVEGISDSIREVIKDAKEARSTLYEALRPNPEQGVRSIEMLSERVKEYDAAIEKAAPKFGVLERGWQKVGDVAKAGSTLVTQGILNSSKSPWERIKHGAGAALMGDMEGVRKAAFAGSFTVDFISVKNAEMREEAERMRRAAMGDIVLLTREENSLRERGIRFGQESVKSEQLRLQARQKIAGIEEKLGIGKLRGEMTETRNDPDLTDAKKTEKLKWQQQTLDDKQKAATDLQKEANRELELAERMHERELAAKVTAIGLETRLIDIRRLGAAVEQANAAARLASAQQLLANAERLGIKSGLEHAGLVKNVAGAQEDSDVATKALVEKGYSLDLSRKAASLRGSSQWVAEETARRELENLRREANAPNTKSDRRAELTQSLIPGGEAKMDQLARQREEMTLSARASRIHADTGRGPQEEITATEKLIALNRDLYAQNERRNSGEKSAADALDAEFRDLKMRREDLNWSENRSLVAAEKQSRVMALEVSGQSQRATYAKESAGYENDILEARRNNRDVLAEEITKQKELASIVKRVSWSPERALGRPSAPARRTRRPAPSPRARSTADCETSGGTSTARPRAAWTR
jgi:hypothetical protein